MEIFQIPFYFNIDIFNFNWVQHCRQIISITCKSYTLNPTLNFAIILLDMHEIWSPNYFVGYNRIVE